MVSGLFFIGLGISIVLVPIVCAFAPIAVWFFNDPRVSGLIILMSLSFPLAALGSQHTALLLRSMRWMTLQWTGLVGHAVGGLAGILVAWKTDLGYWSLAVTTLVAQIVTLLLIWTVCPWRPSLGCRLARSAQRSPLRRLSGGLQRRQFLPPTVGQHHRRLAVWSHRTRILLARLSADVVAAQSLQWAP